MAAAPGQRRQALAVLGLSEPATPAQITRAYRDLAKLTHPDVAGPTGVDAGDRFAAITDAYHRLLPEPEAEPRPEPPPEPEPEATTRSQTPPPWTVRRTRPTRSTRSSRPWQPPIVAGPVVVTPWDETATPTGRRPR